MRKASEMFERGEFEICFIERNLEGETKITLIKRGMAFPVFFRKRRLPSGEEEIIEDHVLQ